MITIRRIMTEQLNWWMDHDFKPSEAMEALGYAPFACGDVTWTEVEVALEQQIRVMRSEERELKRLIA